MYLNREGRHWYEFTESRKRDGPARVFKDFVGYLQADAYGGYDQLYFPGGATEVARWAHVRRKFVDAEPTDPVLSKHAVDRIRALFKIEESAKDLPDDARAQLRGDLARPLLTEFRAWLELAETQALLKSPLGKAIGYALNQWPALLRYVDDGRLSMSNNSAERALRPFAVGPHASRSSMSRAALCVRWTSRTPGAGRGRCGSVSTPVRHRDSTSSDCSRARSAL